MNEETEKFVTELRCRPDVLGVIMFGSWARGNNRQDSDVDLVVILVEGYQRIVEYRNGQAFEIIYTTEKGAFEYWQDHKDDAAGLWAVAKILFDRDGTIERLKSKIKQILDNGKEPIDESRLEQLRFDFEDGLKHVGCILTSDPTSANLILANKIFALTELFFDVRQMWTPAPKQRLAEIQKISPGFYDLLKEFHQEQIALRDKLEISQKIVHKLFR